MAAPMPARPTSVSAQVAGSGTLIGSEKNLRSAPASQSLLALILTNLTVWLFGGFGYHYYNGRNNGPGPLL